MRKILIVICIACMLCCLTVGAGAVSVAQSVDTHATVSHDGTAQVTLTAKIHLDQVNENLLFALPAQATNITVNGIPASGRLENDKRQVELNGIIGNSVGDIALTFQYTLPNMIVTNEAGQLELQMPVLSGVVFPIQALKFSVTLPGPVAAKPAFSSGYHQADIEKDLSSSTAGATITVTSLVELKDHETLKMTLLVNEEMFPQKRVVTPETNKMSKLVPVFLLIALAYWLLLLRNRPNRPVACAIPPDGYTAGELGSILCLQGANLNLMVFTWAQLGYLQIELQPTGKVLLHRQMDMGNERSGFEQRWFKHLFGKRDTVDAGATRYGALYRSVAGTRPNLSTLMHRWNGNLSVFRLLAAVGGLFAGITVAVGLAAGAGAQWFLLVLLGFAALVSCWHIQAWAINLFISGRRKMWIAFALCGIWLLLGALAGQFGSGLGMVLGQLAAGFLAAIGGRRSPAGRQLTGDIAGLRRYLKSLSTEQLRTISRNDPEYFHRMAPYALALGVDKAFAKRFGKQTIENCPYIYTGTDSAMQASQWSSLMRRVLRGMNTRSDQGRWKKTIAQIRSFTR